MIFHGILNSSGCWSVKDLAKSSAQNDAPNWLLCFMQLKGHQPVNLPPIGCMCGHGSKFEPQKRQKSKYMLNMTYRMIGVLKFDLLPCHDVNGFSQIIHDFTATSRKTWLRIWKNHKPWILFMMIHLIPLLFSQQDCGNKTPYLRCIHMFVVIDSLVNNETTMVIFLITDESVAHFVIWDPIRSKPREMLSQRVGHIWQVIAARRCEISMCDGWMMHDVSIPVSDWISIGHLYDFDSLFDPWNIDISLTISAISDAKVTSRRHVKFGGLEVEANSELFVVPRH